ncbi:hypothetical protein AgCh_013543 [Apium graveolens]
MDRLRRIAHKSVPRSRFRTVRSGSSRVRKRCPSQMVQAQEGFKMVMSNDKEKTWTLFADGGSNINGTGLRLILKSPQGDTIAYAIFCEFNAINNEAEYEALILGLYKAKKLKIEHLITFDDLIASGSCRKFFLKDMMTALTQFNPRPESSSEVLSPGWVQCMSQFTVMVLWQFEGQAAIRNMNWSSGKEQFLISYKIGNSDIVDSRQGIG